MDNLSPGQLIKGRYQLVELLGRGALGQTFLAHDQKLDRQVAIKITEPQQNQTTANRFKAEAEAVSALQHPHIASVYDQGRLEDNRLYLVTQWTDGQTLQALLDQQTSLTTHQALDILHAIARALASAHASGIIHRDIKPSNIIIPYWAGSHELRFDQAKLLDFGAFGQLLQRNNVTAGGELFGTPLYMSPEQLRATPQSPASDVYGLGVLLYTMLFGDSPFRRSSVMESITAVVYEEVAIPETRKLAANVRTFLQRCLEKDPTQRPQSGAEALKIIEELLRTADATDTKTSIIDDKAAKENQSHPPNFQSISYRISVIALLLAVALLVWQSRALPVGSPSLPPQASGIVVGIALAVGGVLIGVALRKWLARRKTEIEKQGSKVLFRSKSRDFLSESISIEVEELITRCSAIDEKILGLTIMQMLKEYEVAKESNQRQAALLNTIQLIEKLMNRLSPWYVRHDKLVAFLVSATGILSGAVAVVASVVELIR